MSSALAAVTVFCIPRSMLTDTVSVLAEAGNAGREAFVVWGGTVSDGGTTVMFGTVITPAQTAHRTSDGLLVTVDGEALFVVNRTLYRRGELLAGQVHSHPTAAYHSDTDDHYPLVTLTGALSVVVPDFAANAPGDIARWAWYRLVGTGEWAELSRNDRIELLG
jgi:hypothetical protein